jgi:hypothetical protein
MALLPSRRGSTATRGTALGPRSKLPYLSLPRYSMGGHGPSGLVAHVQVAQLGIRRCACGTTIGLAMAAEPNLGRFTQKSPAQPIGRLAFLVPTAPA